MSELYVDSDSGCISDDMESYGPDVYEVFYPIGLDIELSVGRAVNKVEYIAIV